MLSYLSQIARERLMSLLAFVPCCPRASVYVLPCAFILIPVHSLPLFCYSDVFTCSVCHLLIYAPSCLFFFCEVARIPEPYFFVCYFQELLLVLSFLKADLRLSTASFRVYALGSWLHYTKVKGRLLSTCSFSLQVLLSYLAKHEFYRLGSHRKHLSGGFFWEVIVIQELFFFPDWEQKKFSREKSLFIVKSVLELERVRQRDVAWPKIQRRNISMTIVQIWCGYWFFFFFKPKLLI